MTAHKTLFTPIAILFLVLSATQARATGLDVLLWDSRYGTLDDTTGRFAQISTLSVHNPGGIASMNGLLYLEDFGSNLYTVDTISGATHLVGNSSATLSFAAFAGGSNGLFALGYDANLYSINSATAKATKIGATGLAANNGNFDTSLSFDGTALYYTQGASDAADTLYQIDATTGAARSLGSTGVTGVAGSALVNGSLELFQYGQNRNYIYSAPVLTTSFTRQAQLNAQILVGGTTLAAASQTLQTRGSVLLDTAAPEPSAPALLWIGLLLMALYSRRTRVSV